MDKAGLQLVALAEFTGISESHLYGILNGTKKLTGPVADQIATKFNMQGWQLLHLEYALPRSLNTIQELQEFYEEYRHARNFFTHEIKLKPATQIEQLLLNGNFLNQKRSIAEILAHCKAHGLNLNSKQLSQHLHYLGQKSLLQKEKQKITLKDGSLGNRLIDVFWK